MHLSGRTTAAIVAALVATLTATVLGVTQGTASSHREAPLLIDDPEVDNTDVYAFVSPDEPDTVTLIANWTPFQEPAGGPNFYRFDDDAQYDIHIDNNGDARPDITYRWEFGTAVRGPNSIQLASGRVDSLDDEDLNIVQRYNLTEIRDGRTRTLLRNARVVPSHVGEAAMPDYASLREAGVLTIPKGRGTAFAGQADDPFFLDLRIFDLLYGGDLSEVGYDTLNGFNVQSVALQVPMEDLAAGGDADANPIIGVYSSTQRPSLLRFGPGSETAAGRGEMVRVSRLGNPLVNEVVIPIKRKDDFNNSAPSGDARFLRFVQNPVVPPLLEHVYDIEAPATPRNDLVQVFLTGVPDLNKPARVTPSEMLRLNMSIPPSDDPERLGVLAEDTAGFPNGRRLTDDVVDIGLQVLAGALVATDQDLDPQAIGELGDAVDANDKEFEESFPYLALPHPGSASSPHGDSGDDGFSSGEGRLSSSGDE